MRNFTQNQFPIKYCWSIPCLPPLWRLRTLSVYSLRKPSLDVFLFLPFSET